MKKLFIMMLAGLLLVGCGNADTPDTEANNGEDTQQTQTQEAETEKDTIHTHAYTESITTEATCEVDGVKTFTCECGDSYTEAITATGHSYGEYVYNNDASTSADGTETATCAVCGGTDTRTKAGTKKEEVAATPTGDYWLTGFWVNCCGHELPQASKGDCPYAVGTPVEETDEYFMAYWVKSHGVFKDGAFVILDPGNSGDIANDYARAKWPGCRGGHFETISTEPYNQGCVHYCKVTPQY